MENILVLANDFTGAYGSLNCYVQEMAAALRKKNIRVLVAGTVPEAVAAYENNEIDFSIGIGKYAYFWKGHPLYDWYHKLHYQWIIDNPLKMEIDTGSSYIKYVLIDKLFSLCMEKVQNPVLYLPIGFPETNSDSSIEKKKGIVFAGQVRDSNTLLEDINNSSNKTEIMKVLEPLMVNLDLPYIPELMRNVGKLPQSVRQDTFALTNSFLRAYKREKVLAEIRNLPLTIIGEVRSKALLNKANLKIVGKVPYYKSFEIMRQYQFSLNIEPNFNCGFHDRAVRSAVQGNVVITNYSKMQSEVWGNAAIYYSYSAIARITDQILNLRETELEEMESRLSQVTSLNFSWDRVLEFLLCDYGGTKDNVKNRLFGILGN